MSPRIINKLRDIKQRLTDKEKHTYLKNRHVKTTAPYALQVYDQLLGQLKANANITVHPFHEIHTDKDTVNFYVRHDIDHTGCMQNMPAMLDINLKYGFHAGVYFLVWDREYHLGDHKGVVKEYRDKGFEMGLHTICYAQDDYMSAFQRETDKFENEVGFRPTTFTVHGLGKERIDVRKRFYKEIQPRLAEFGYTFTDGGSYQRKYDHVIEDCHYNATQQKRYIFDDWDVLPPFLKKGSHYLVLTHPCYWQ